MLKKYKILITSVLLITIGYLIYTSVKKFNPNLKYAIGQKLDSLNGVYVHFNGGVGNIEERNLSDDGYNIGLKYQCVEFVKRYYYEYYKHKMPDSYGNAKDFFDKNISDGEINTKRNLLQFTNPSISKPEIGDLIIFNGSAGNPYGHVAIISTVHDSVLEIIQQNPGPFASSRANFFLTREGEKYKINSSGALGWLRMKN